jgi:hypothetical protein
MEKEIRHIKIGRDFEKVNLLDKLKLSLVDTHSKVTEYFVESKPLGDLYNSIVYKTIFLDNSEIYERQICFWDMDDPSHITYINKIGEGDKDYPRYKSLLERLTE